SQASQDLHVCQLAWINHHLHLLLALLLKQSHAFRERTYPMLDDILGADLLVANLLCDERQAI
ncbi:MAG: hypothetical protein ACKN82_13310, partial [Pirellula sp.]